MSINTAKKGEDPMGEEMKKWTEEQIVEAFNNFRNSNAAKSPEEAEATLRSYLKEIGEGPYMSTDIMSVAEKIVPYHCLGQITAVIVNWLCENASQPTIH